VDVSFGGHYSTLYTVLRVLRREPAWDRRGCGFSLKGHFSAPKGVVEGGTCYFLASVVTSGKKSYSDL